MSPPQVWTPRPVVSCGILSSTLSRRDALLCWRHTGETLHYSLTLGFFFFVQSTPLCRLAPYPPTKLDNLWSCVCYVLCSREQQQVNLCAHVLALVVELLWFGCGLPFSLQHGGVWGPVHQAGHHGKWEVQVLGQHSAPEEQVRSWWNLTLHTVLLTEMWPVPNLSSFINVLCMFFLLLFQALPLLLTLSFSLPPCLSGLGMGTWSQCAPRPAAV